MPERITLAKLAAKTKYKPSPGSTQYVLRPHTDDRPGIVGVLRAPTDELVEEYDRVAQANGRNATRLEIAVARLSALKAKMKKADEPDELDELADLIESAQEEAAELDPANPDGQAYYVDNVRRRGVLALDVYFVGSTKYERDAEAGPVCLFSEDDDEIAETGIETGVLDTAVTDFLGLAFSTRTSRSA